jgi:hypothetical protein
MHEDEKSRRISPVLIFNEFQNRPFTEGRRCIRGGVLKIHALSQTATCLSSCHDGLGNAGSAYFMHLPQRLESARFSVCWLLHF